MPLFLLPFFLIWNHTETQPFEYGLPLLSGSQLGIYYPVATAWRETILNQVGPQAAFLNPGVLGLTENLQLAVCGNSYNYEN